ncbi:hemagglutinin repeat-containing protein, partial [Ralstonia pseudosolanacearum]
GYAVSIAQSVEQAGRAVEQHKDPRVAALYLAQAGLMGYNAAQSGTNSNDTGVGASNVPSAQTQTQAQSSAIVKATVSIGGGSSSSESSASANVNQGSTLRAGQNVTITATGKDASGKVVDGDIVARGSSISGRNVSLDAARDITLESRQDNTHQDSKSGGSNASIGVGFALGGNQNGFTLELAAGFNRAHADGDAVTHVNSSVNAADTLTLNAGRDANLRGAQASGNTVNATVGRNLNVESRQDADNYASRSESGGAQVSLCIPPFCIGSAFSGSANLAEGKTDSTYASVVHQSGIAAGTGGYNVNVKGNTDLVGGVISSTADPSKNTLRTGTLTTRDVENHAAYSSEQSSFSASYTSSNPLNSDAVPSPLQQGVSNLASNAVGNAQGPIAGNASGTTRSAISAGTVVITDNAGQVAKTGKDAEATVAGLNRDTAHANDGAIGKIFDQKKVEEQQEIARLQAQVVQQVAPILYTQVGDMLVGQPAVVKTAVHALIGGLISRAMGGEFATGAVGAGAAALAVEAFGKQLLAIDGLSEGDRKALVQLVGMAVSGMAAGAAGGSTAGVAAAAGTAQIAVQNNFLAHEQREQRKKDLAACKSAQECDAVTAAWDAISKKQQADAQACISSDSCKVVLNVLVWPAIESALNEAKAECAPPRMCSAQAQEDINQLQHLWNQKDAIQSFYEVEKFVAEFVAVGKGITVAIGAVSKAVEIARGLRAADEAAKLTAGDTASTLIKGLPDRLLADNIAGDGMILHPINVSPEVLSVTAQQPFKEGQLITNAGRAVTKHPEYFGFDSTQELRKVYRTDTQLNELAANSIREILRDGVRTTGAGGRYPNGWVTYTLPDGRAASWASSGDFIGFRGVSK